MVDEYDEEGSIESFKAEDEPQKKFKPLKPYLTRLKRHSDAILVIHALNGENGNILISGSADEKIRIWDMKKKTISSAIEVERPHDNVLIRYQAVTEDNLPLFPDGQTNRTYSGMPREDPNNPLSGLPPKKQHIFVTCFDFCETLVFLGYEDGLICCWELSNKKFRCPLIGHTNRINGLDQAGGFIYSCANDCTVRQWETLNCQCVNIFKFSDPINTTKVDFENKFMYTASWDKMIRVVDLEKKVIMKAFVASKETIKVIKLSDQELIVAGCDPVIRSFNLENGATKLFQGHKGWVYCLLVKDRFLFSGGDDNFVRIWDLETTIQVEKLNAHRNGVTQITLCNKQIFTGSFDHYIIQWDFPGMLDRIKENKLMRQEDIESRKIEVYYRFLEQGKKKKTTR